MRMNTLIHPINNIEKLSTELKDIRRYKQITQQQLAERCLWSRRTITNAESAHNVGLVEFTRMANALGYELVLRPQKTVVFEELADIFSEDD